MFAVSEAEYLDVVDAYGPACRCYVAGGGVEDAVVGAGEGSFFDGDVVDDVQAVDVDVGVGEGGEPAAEELDAGLFAAAPDLAGRLEGDVVGEYVGEADE